MINDILQNKSLKLTVEVQAFKLVIITSFLVFNIFSGKCQSHDLTYGEKIFRLTALIYTYSGHSSYQASSFFYSSLEGNFLISNRHVLFPKEHYPDSIIINLKKNSKKTGKVDWKPIKIDKEYLHNNLKIHKNKNIDVAALDMNKLLKSLDGTDLFFAYAVSIPDSISFNNINPEIGDDALILGYPKGYYDSYNKIPIMKSGVISSFYGVDFNNLPCFLIDSKLFHGSSGSVVISKPQPVKIKDGLPMFATKKDFIFLGIFSGEPYIYGERKETDDEISIKKEKFDLGIVWYPKVINQLDYASEIIK